MLLYSTKVFAIGGVYNLWCWLWTGGNDDNITASLDTVILNESIYMEIAGETVPQVALQTINNYLINPNIADWGPVNLASLTVTLLNTLNGIWKIIYWKLMRGVNLVDIPISFGISVLRVSGDEGSDGHEMELMLTKKHAHISESDLHALIEAHHLNLKAMLRHEVKDKELQAVIGHVDELEKRLEPIVHELERQLQVMFKQEQEVKL